MAIQDRDLAAGTRLWARSKGATHTAEVVQTGQGVRYRLADGREFKSPSSAGGAITGHACNGWAFWTVGAPPEKAQGEQDRRRGPSAAAKANGSAHPVPKPAGKAKRGKQAQGSSTEAAEGIECQACGQAFPTPAEATTHLAEAHPA